MDAIPHGFGVQTPSTCTDAVSTFLILRSILFLHIQHSNSSGLQHCFESSICFALLVGLAAPPLQVATLKRQLATANAARSDAEAREQAAAQREQEAWRQARALRRHLPSRPQNTSRHDPKKTHPTMPTASRPIVLCHRQPFPWRHKSPYTLYEY